MLVIPEKQVYIYQHSHLVNWKKKESYGSLPLELNIVQCPPHIQNSLARGFLSKLRFHQHSPTKVHTNNTSAIQPIVHECTEIVEVD